MNYSSAINSSVYSAITSTYNNSERITHDATNFRNGRFAGLAVAATGAGATRFAGSSDAAAGAGATGVAGLVVAASGAVATRI